MRWRYRKGDSRIAPTPEKTILEHNLKRDKTKPAASLRGGPQSGPAKQSARNDALPPGWVWTTLGEACEIVMGQSPPSSTYNIDGVGLPFYQGKAEFGDLYPTPVKWCSKPGKIAELGDVLISVRAPVGPTNLCQEKSCIGRGLAAVRPQSGMPSRYFLYALRHFEQKLAEKATGTTFAAISGKVLRDQKVPLAPLPEQYRIVAKVEELLTELDAGIAALKQAQANLRRYKAAVLSAACQGRLVPQDPNDEPASELLGRILVERRATTGGATARGARRATARVAPTMVAPTIVAPTIATPTIAAPTIAGTDIVGASLADAPLPEGWCWATVAQLGAHEPSSITDGPFGSNLKTEHYTEAGPRVIRLQNIGDGEFYDEKAHISEEHFMTLRRHEVFAGDLVIAGLGEILPRACIIPEYVGQAIVKADCIRFKPHPALADAKYLNAALNSEPLKKAAARIIHGVGRPRLNQQEIKSLPIPLPPLAEQHRIVAEVERRLSVAQELEAAIAANLARAGRLRQSILKRAFEGKLVPQDPNDEPASALLERIRASRNEATVGANVGASGANVGATLVVAPGARTSLAPTTSRAPTRKRKKGRK